MADGNEKCIKYTNCYGGVISSGLDKEPPNCQEDYANILRKTKISSYKKRYAHGYLLSAVAGDD